MKPPIEGYAVLSIGNLERMIERIKDRYGEEKMNCLVFPVTMTMHGERWQLDSYHLVNDSMDYEKDSQECLYTLGLCKPKE